MKYVKFFVVFLSSLFIINVSAEDIEYDTSKVFDTFYNTYANEDFFNNNCFILDSKLKNSIGYQIAILRNNTIYYANLPYFNSNSELVFPNACRFSNNDSTGTLLCGYNLKFSNFDDFIIFAVRDNVIFPSEYFLNNNYYFSDTSLSKYNSFFPYLNKYIYEVGKPIESLCYKHFGNNHNTDNVAPVINLVGNSEITIEINTIFNDPGYSCSDNFDKTCNVVVTGSVDVSKLGKYILEYNAIDSSGNSAVTSKRIVNVVDTTAPVLSLIGDSILYYGLNQEYEELGFNVSDNSNEDINVDVDISNLDVTVSGTYDIIYSACDSSKNCTSLIRKVKVQSIEALDFTGSQYLFYNFSDIQDLFPNFNFNGMTNVEQFAITIIFNIFIALFLLLIIYIILKSVYKMLSIIW